MEYSSKKTDGKGTSGKNKRSWYPMKQWWKWICIVKARTVWFYDGVTFSNIWL
jgi:hypothetical protein